MTLSEKFQVAIVWPEFRQSCPWKCSISRPTWYKAHVAVTEKFTITDVVNVVTQLQLQFCKSIQHLFKYPTNKKFYHNFLQNHTKSISIWNLSNHKSSKNSLNIRSVAVTTMGMQIGLVIPTFPRARWFPGQFLDIVSEKSSTTMQFDALPPFIFFWTINKLLRCFVQ